MCVANLVHIEVFPEESSLLYSRLFAVVDENVSEGGHCVFRLPQSEGLPTNGEVDVIFSQCPTFTFIHLQSLAVAPQCMSLLEQRKRECEPTH